MENQNTGTGRNYFKNAPTSKGRTVRLEVVGEVSRTERNFLNGILHFTSGILSRDSESYITFVSGIMIRLIKHLIARAGTAKDPHKDKDGFT